MKEIEVRCKKCKKLLFTCEYAEKVVAVCSRCKTKSEYRIIKTERALEHQWLKNFERAIEHQ